MKRKLIITASTTPPIPVSEPLAQEIEEVKLSEWGDIDLAWRLLFWRH